ncbi:hypothetical protein THAOC_13889, partial [Thalassiosira oceanica]
MTEVKALVKAGICSDRESSCCVLIHGADSIGIHSAHAQVQRASNAGNAYACILLSGTFVRVLQSFVLLSGTELDSNACEPARIRMADDDRAKRLKTSESSEDCSVAIAEVAELQGRQIAELESENEILRLENAQFRGLLAKGDHTVLPVVRVVTATVDLSRVDTNIVTQISSFLGSSDELFNLALTCKSFGWRQPTSTLNWSLVEEVARQAVRSRATDAEMNSLPQYF